MITTKEVFKFTQPVTKKGKTGYLNYLENIAGIRRYQPPAKYSWKAAKKDGISITLQHLRQKGLIKYSNGTFKITAKGLDYLRLANSGAMVTRSVYRNLIEN